MIKKIKVKNFKSFCDLEAELGNFNVLIGANASGKSNFIKIFEFLRDIARFGLENAVSMQGGAEYLRNINFSRDQNLYISITWTPPKNSYFTDVSDKEQSFFWEIVEITYEFELEFNGKDSGFKVAKNNLIKKCEFFEKTGILEQQDARITKFRKIGDGEVLISANRQDVSISLENTDNIPVTINDIYPPVLVDFLKAKLSENTLLIEKGIFFLPLVEEFFQNISKYDFNPKEPKKIVPIEGKADLEKDGSNLAIVLKKILKNKKKKEELFELLKTLLPFVSDLEVEDLEDKSLKFKLKETYFSEDYVPASMLSDGTINLIALLVALYFEEHSFMIIEEPERNIYPCLISKLMEMFKEVSVNKQILITTHHPEVVRYAGVENLLLMSRTPRGCSIISKPADKESVKVFLANEVGIEELYVQDLLEE